MIDSVQETSIKTVLITGGTGSFGAAMTRYLMDNTAARVRIYSRDEHKQERLLSRFADYRDRITTILGDVRDRHSLKIASAGCDAVIAAAALKRIPFGETSAEEFSMTNISGTGNTVRAAIACGVPRSLFISSDKACQPVNTYGKSKAMGESLFVQANKLGIMAGCRFAIVRGGNVWGSRGSVVEIWRERRASGLDLEVTYLTATRFFLPMPEWVAFCWRALTEQHGGEIFCPKLRAWRLGDLAAAFDSSTVITGARDGDKVHEFMFSLEESERVRDIGWAYVIEPATSLRAVWDYREWSGERVDGPCSSDSASRMSVEELRSVLNLPSTVSHSH